MPGRGPAPTKPSSAKRRSASTPGFRQLPYDGRSGDPPDFPLDDPSDRELTQWRKLWSLPQATMWEGMRCEDTVALYVRAFVLATTTGNYKMMNEARQLDSKLGLSPRAMQDLRWEIEPAPLADPTPNGATPGGRVYVPKVPS